MRVPLDLLFSRIRTCSERPRLCLYKCGRVSPSVRREYPRGAAIPPGVVQRPMEKRSSRPRRCTAKSRIVGSLSLVHPFEFFMVRTKKSALDPPSVTGRVGRSMVSTSTADSSVHASSHCTKARTSLSESRARLWPPRTTICLASGPPVTEPHCHLP